MRHDADRAGLSAAWGVMAGILGGGAFAIWATASPPHSGFPVWPAWILGALAACAVYMCFAFALGTWPAGRGRMGRASVIIDEPLPDRPVAQAATARGRARRVPRDETLWLVVQAGDNFYPQAKVRLSPDGTGSWARLVHFGSVGGDSGEEFTLVAVGAGPAASSRFEIFLQREEAHQKPAALRETDGTYPAVRTYASVSVIRGL